MHTMSLYKSKPSGTLFPQSDLGSSYLSSILTTAVKAIGEGPGKGAWPLDKNLHLIKINQDNYVLIDKSYPLGDGAAGTVYRCRHLAVRENQLSLMPVDSESPYGAVKVSKLDTSQELTEKLPSLYANEAKSLSEIGYSTCQKPILSNIESAKQNQYILPMRYISGPTLTSDMTKDLGEVQQAREKVLRVFDGLLQTVNYLHDKARTHLDINENNIILETIERNGKKQVIPRLVDFSISSDVKEDGYAKLSSSESSKDIIKEYHDQIEDTGDSEAYQVRCREEDAEEIRSSMRGDSWDAMLGEPVDLDEMGFATEVEMVTEDAEEVHEDKISEHKAIDDRAIIITDVDPSLYVHKNIDILHICNVIDRMLHESKLEETDNDFFKRIKNMLEDIRELNPQERNIVKIREQLAGIAKVLEIPLEKIPDPFVLSYSPKEKNVLSVDLSKSSVDSKTKTFEVKH